MTIGLRSAYRPSVVTNQISVKRNFRDVDRSCKLAVCVIQTILAKVTEATDSRHVGVLMVYKSQRASLILSETLYFTCKTRVL